MPEQMGEDNRISKHWEASENENSNDSYSPSSAYSSEDDYPLEKETKNMSLSNYHNLYYLYYI